MPPRLYSQPEGRAASKRGLQNSDVDSTKRIEWKEAMIAAIRGALDDIFGTNSTMAVLYHLKDGGMTIEAGVERPNELIEALTGIFGAGAKAIEAALIDGVGEAAGIDVKGMSLDRALSKTSSMLKSPHG